MAQLLTWSEVDATLQNQMGNRIVSESKRIEAVNDEVKNITTEYDLETTIKTVEIYLIPNGTAYLITALVDSSSVLVMTNDDLKSIASIVPDDDDFRDEYTWVERDEFERNILDGINRDEYTTYFESGKMYIKMNSVNGETTATKYNMSYYSNYCFTNAAGTFVEEISTTNPETYNILLPKRFKDLVIAGAKKRLLWPSIGEDGNNQYVIESNKYKSELKKLGLDNISEPIKSSVKKLKIREW